MPDKFDYYKRWEYVSFLREFTKRGQKQSSTESEQLHFTTNSRRQYNTILWERFITSVQRPPNLLFQKKENRKESKQHGTPLSFWEKLSWLVYQFSKEFKSCFLHTPSTSLIETQACFVRKKKPTIFHFMLFFLFVRLRTHLYWTHSESIIRRNDLPYFPC